MAEYIEFDAVIDAIDKTTWYHQNINKDMVEGANSKEHQPWFKSQDIYAAIQSIPAADVKPVVHGRWIYDTTTDEFACSVCDGLMVRNVFNFCPWCGAELRKKKEAQDGSN